MHVLVVDDSRVIRIQLINMFHECGITEITEACDGKEALEQLARQTYHLVTLDMHMPQMNGYECLKAMKSNPQLQNISTVIVTSDTDKMLIKKFTDLGAGAFLRKPFHIDYFLMAVTSACPFLDIVEEYEDDSALQT